MVLASTINVLLARDQIEKDSLALGRFKKLKSHQQNLLAQKPTRGAHRNTNCELNTK